MFDWNYHFNLTDVAFVDLQYNQTMFDWCDLDSYTKEGVRPILEFHNINVEAVNNGSLKWVASFATNVQLYCDPALSNEMDNYIFSWYSAIGVYLQNTGLVGIVDNWYAPAHYLLWTTRGVDKATGTVSSSLFWGIKKSPKEFIGQKLHIYGGLLSRDDWGSMYAEYEASLEAGNPFMISMSDTENPLEGYVTPGHTLYYTHRIMVATTVLLVVACTYHALRCLVNYVRNYKWGFNYSLMCLLFAILGNVFRFIVVIDPESMLGITTIDDSVLAASLSDSCHVFSSLASLIVRLDLLLTIVHINQGDSYRSFAAISQSVAVRVLFLLTLFVAGAFDLVISYYSKVMSYDPLFGSLGGAYFPDENGVGGVYGDCLWKVARLLIISIMEVVLAIKIRTAMVQMTTASPRTAPTDAVDETKKKTKKDIIGASTPKVAPAPLDPSKDLATNMMTNIAMQSGGGTSAAHIFTSSPKGIKDSEGSASASNSTPFKLQTIKKLHTFSTLMVASGVCMIVASIFIFLNGAIDLYSYIQPRPYLYSFIYMFPWWLLQCSSFLEVRAIEEVMAASKKE